MPYQDILVGDLLGAIDRHEVEPLMGTASGPGISKRGVMAMGRSLSAAVHPLHVLAHAGVHVDKRVVATGGTQGG